MTRPRIARSRDQIAAMDDEEFGRFLHSTGLDAKVEAVMARRRETPAGAVEALGPEAWRALADALHKAEPQRDADCYHGLTISDCQIDAEDILAAIPEPYSLTRSVDVERWQRIETAARLVLRMEDEKRLSDDSGTGALDDLREAVEEVR